MDYPKLYTFLPKQPIKWTVNDIQIWLQFIGLSTLYDKFSTFLMTLGQLSIDGSCLGTLTEQDLREELCIQSGITVKKIMACLIFVILGITKGLDEYDEFLKMPIAGASQVEYSEQNQITHKSKPFELKLFTSQSQNLKRQSSLKVQHNEAFNQQPNLNKVVSCGDAIKQPQRIIDEKEEQTQDKKQFELIIQQCEGQQNSFFSVKEDGAKIGRHSTNQILILDQSISRFHAQIKYNHERFYITDLGSTTGTFIKIFQKIQILPNMILQMGSNQFQSNFTNQVLTLQIIEGPAEGYMIEIPKNSKVTIGRKQTNTMIFQDDQHLSNIHAAIFSIDNKYYLQDMGTTNGSWLRLSPQGQPSSLYELIDKQVFKFGASQTYTCKIKTQIVCQKISPNSCIICFENDKDCVYMPCKHNTACIRCSKNLRECPICRNKIEDYVRIYRS